MTHRTHSWKTNRRVDDMRNRAAAKADIAEIDIPRFGDAVRVPKKSM